MTTLIELKHLIGCAEHGAKIEGYSVLAETWITVDDDDGVMNYSALRIKPPKLTTEQAEYWEWRGEFGPYTCDHNTALIAPDGSGWHSNIATGSLGYILHRKKQEAEQPDCDLCGNRLNAIHITPPELTPDQADAWEWTGEFREYLPMEDDAVFVELSGNKGSYVIYAGTHRKLGHILRRKEQTAEACDLCGNQLNADGYCDKDGWRDDEPDEYEPYTLKTFPHRPMMFRWKHEPHPVLLSVFAFRANSIFGHAWGYDGTEMITPEIFLDKCEWADGSPCGVKKGSE